MKDITIKGKQIQRELITFLLCFGIGFFANVGAILYYKTNFSELYTSLLYVLTFSVALYLFWSFMRILIFQIKHLVSRRKNK